MIGKQKQLGHLPPMKKYSPPHPLIEAMLGTTFAELRKRGGRLRERLPVEGAKEDEASTNRPEG